MSRDICLSKVFKTDIDTLFDLWTKPEHLRQWHHPHNPGFSTPRAEVDLKVGGNYLIVIQSSEGPMTVHGEFTAINRPHALAYTWQWEGSNEVTQVRLSLKTVAHGTELTLIHEHPDNSVMAESHKEGWEGCFVVLEQLINKEA